MAAITDPKERTATAPMLRLVRPGEKIPDSFAIADLPDPRDPYIYFRLHRATTITFLVSLVVHLLLLFALPQPEMEPFGQQGEPGPMGVAAPPMQVSMTPPRSSPAVVTQLPAPAETSSKSRPRSAKSTARPMTQSVTPAPAVAPQPAPVETTATDMESYVKAQQARRRAAQGLPALPTAEEAAAAESAARNARAMANLRSGTNGIFQLISIKERSAAFSFQGWTTDISNSRREYISVEIGTNPSIELAVVRKMIELIRKHYQGDFNWESQRLDRVVVLSARPRDTEGLEEFLMREFFANRRN